MTIVDDELDEGTPGELIPDLGGAVPTSAIAACEECSSTFVGPARYIQRAAHMKSVHGHFTPVGKHGTPKKTAAKKVPAKKTPAPRASSTPAATNNPARRAPRRKPANELIEQLAGWIGDNLADYQIDVPVGRVLTLEAPMLGAGLDEAVAGTVVDRWIVQPAINAEERFDKIGAPLGLLLGVAICERRPEMYPVMLPGLSWCVEEMLEDLVDAYVEKAKRKKKKVDAAKKLATLDPMFATIFGTSPDADPVRAVLDAIFAPEPHDNGSTTDGNAAAG